MDLLLVFANKYVEMEEFLNQDVMMEIQIMMMGVLKIV